MSNNPDEHGEWIRNNLPGTPYDADDAERKQIASSLLKCPPISFTVEQAEAIAAQFHETTQHRSWKLQTFAVMSSHFHVVLTADDAVKSAGILGDLKSYASRRLNQQWIRPASETWWTESGSCRAVKDDDHFVNVIRYVANQQLKLAFWIDPALTYLLNTPERGASAP